MAFEAEDRKTILARLKDDYSKYRKNNASAVEGTFAFDSLAANSVEFQTTQAEIELLIEAVFAQTSWGEYLEKLADELGNGMKRRPATSAVAMLTLAGEEGTAVNVGTLFATAAGINFLTTERCTIGADGKVSVKAQAQNAGAEGNVKAGTIVKTPIPVYGVRSVTNEEDAYNGYDAETDEELRGRLLFKIRQPVTSGNANEYVSWAESVPGVGAAKCKPLWNGNGTVKVIVVDADNERANEQLISDVADYIETVRPIGATVTVTTPEPMTVNVAAKVKSSVSEAACREAATSALKEYFLKDGFSQNYVSIARIGKILLDTGVIEDYDSLTLNGGITNLAIDADHVPRLGTLSLEVTS